MAANRQAMKISVSHEGGSMHAAWMQPHDGRSQTSRSLSVTCKPSAQRRTISVRLPGRWGGLEARRYSGILTCSVSTKKQPYLRFTRYRILALRQQLLPSSSVYSSRITLSKSSSASLSNDTPPPPTSMPWPTWVLCAASEQEVMRMREWRGRRSFRRLWTACLGRAEEFCSGSFNR
jgi:hypothetical protein